MLSTYARQHGLAIAAPAIYRLPPEKAHLAVEPASSGPCLTARLKGFNFLSLHTSLGSAK
ncbi:hypothetical protein DFAR_2610005 [Desulfarculales bacterium]